VLHGQADTVTDGELDRFRKAVEHVTPVDRRARAGTVLADQAFDEIEAKPLHNPEASARPPRNDFDHPSLGLQGGPREIQAICLEIVGQDIVRDAIDLQIYSQSGEVIECRNRETGGRSTKK
jgi:hypothetical protein